MFKRTAQLLGLWLLAFSSALHALGLGEIEVKSQLNQPLRATISLPSATAAELETLTVRVAPNSAFDRAGIELVEYVTSLNFEVQGGAQPHVLVSSNDLAREPFLSFLVEARWAGGRILREYTVLLDPPNLAAAREPAPQAASTTPAPAAAATPAPARQPQAVQAKPAEPIFFEEDPASQPSAGAGDNSRRYSTEPEAEQANPPAASTRRPAPPVAVSQAPAAGASTYGPVQRQETLWSIAYKLRPDPDAVTMDQMLISLYETNPDSFAGGLNGLRTGSILTVPPLLDIVSVDPAEAKRRVDAARKSGGPSRAAAAPTPRPRQVEPARPKPAEPQVEPELEPEPEPEPAPAPVQQTRPTRPVADDAESALAQLQALAGQQQASQPSTPSDAGSSDAEVVDEALEPEAVDTSDEAIDDGIAADDMPVEEEIIDEPDVEVEPEPASRPVQAPEDEGGLPWLGIGLGLLVLLLGGAGFVLFKRRQQGAQAVPSAEPATTEKNASDADVADDTASFSATAAAVAAEQSDDKPDPASQTGEFDGDELMDETQSLPDDLDVAAETESSVDSAADEVDFDVTSQFEADTMQINLDANDPVSEADFHLAYGLYDEAALLLQQAQEKEPNRQDIKIKLAETYFAGGKTEEFLDAARNLKGELPDAEWQKIAIMGSQIAPDDELFQDSGDAAAEGVDLDFGGDDAASAEAAPASPPAEEAAGLELPVEDEQPLSFDLDLDDDSTPAPEAKAEARDAAKADSDDDNALEFDLGDFDLAMDDESSEPQEAAAEKPQAEKQDSAAPASTDGNEIESLDLDSLDMGPSTDLGPDTSSEMNAPGIDLGNFDFDEPADDAVSEAPADGGRKEPSLDDDSAADLDFSDLGLDEDAGDAGISDGDEASTKLDLARAYIDMGDNEMAKGLLDEVAAQGNDEQKQAAQELIQRLPD